MIQIHKPFNVPKAVSKKLSELVIGEAFIASTDFDKNLLQLFLVVQLPDGFKKAVYRLATDEDRLKDFSASIPFTTVYSDSPETKFFNYRPVNLKIIAEYQ